MYEFNQHVHEYINLVVIGDTINLMYNWFRFGVIEANHKLWFVNIVNMFIPYKDV